VSVVRVGLVGLGSMGRNHARVLESMDGVELVGVFDQSIESRESAPYPRSDSLDELLGSDLDYLTIATPTHTHVEIALKALEVSMPCLIEKPVAMSVEDAKQLDRAFSEAGVLGGVGHVERFNPAVWEAKKRIEEGELGPIHSIQTRRVGPFPGRILDVGVALDLATHDVDATTWLLGSPYERVSAEVSRVMPGPHEDLIAAVGQLENGAGVSHIVNWVSPYKQREIVIVGATGAFRIDTLEGRLMIFRNGSLSSTWNEVAQLSGVTQGDVLIPEILRVEPLVREHEEFIKALQGKNGIVATLPESVAVLQVCESFLAH